MYLLQGPLFVFGGIDPQADRSIPAPIMLPGETPGIEVRAGQPRRCSSIEPNQVDTLNVFNDDSISDDIGELTVDAAHRPRHGRATSSSPAARCAAASPTATSRR